MTRALDCLSGDQCLMHLAHTLTDTLPGRESFQGILEVAAAAGITPWLGEDVDVISSVSFGAFNKHGTEKQQNFSILIIVVALIPEGVSHHSWVAELNGQSLSEILYACGI